MSEPPKAQSSKKKILIKRQKDESNQIPINEIPSQPNKLTINEFNIPTGCN
jgi:hypothetical protein